MIVSEAYIIIKADVRIYYFLNTYHPDSIVVMSAVAAAVSLYVGMISVKCNLANLFFVVFAELKG